MKNLILVLFTLFSVTTFSQENPALLNEQNPKEYAMTEEDFRELLRFKKSDLNIDSLKQEIFKLFNEYRIYKGLPEFEYSDILEKSANIQVKYMSENRILTHTHKDKELNTTKDRIEYVDINDVMVSEKYGEICSQKNYINIIARKRTLPQSVLDGFYSSLAHRHIIEKEMYTDMGIGIYKKPNSQTFYVCIDFCVSKK